MPLSLATIAVLGLVALAAARTIAAVVRHFDFATFVRVARPLAGREGGAARLGKLAHTLPNGPLATLLRGVTGTVDAAAGHAPEEARERIAVAAAPHVRRFFEVAQAQPAADLGLLAALGVAAAAAMPMPVWLGGLAGAAALATLWMLDRRRKLVRDVRALLPDLYEVLVLASPAAAPRPEADELRPSPPLTCSGCGSGELATGALLPDCDACVCLACGQVEWKVRDVEALLAAGRLRRVSDDN